MTPAGIHCHGNSPGSHQPRTSLSQPLPMPLRCLPQQVKKKQRLRAVVGESQKRKEKNMERVGQVPSFPPA